MFFIFWGLYIILTLMSLYVTYFSNKYDKNIYFFLFSFLLLLLIFRPETVPDYLSYKNIFETLNISNSYSMNLFTREAVTGVEYGFVYIILIFKFIFGNNFSLFLLLITGLSICLTVEYFYKVMKKLSLLNNNLNEYYYKIVILTVLSCYYILNYQAIAIRAGLSFMLGLISFYYFLENKYIISILAVFIGFSLQRMTIIMVPIIALYHFLPVLKNKRHYFYLSIFISLLFVVLDKTGIINGIFIFLNERARDVFVSLSLGDYVNYIDSISFSNVLDMKRIWMILMNIYISFFVGENVKEKKLMNVVLCGSILIYLTANIIGSARIYDYLCFYSVPLMVKIWLSNNRNYFESIISHKFLGFKELSLYKNNIIADMMFLLIILGFYVASFHVWKII